ncbi:hypothetical protein N9D63_00735 [Opitutales bacterium]|nr:hypothetical protein [Opitutales bacterium]
MKHLILPLLTWLSIALHSHALEKNGVVEGILISKDKNSITVLPDGAKEPKRFTPHWRGGLPKDGGGLEKKMLEEIRNLITTNRVRVKWEFEERARVVEVKTLVPKSKKGTITGTIVAKGENSIDVKPFDKGPAERYLPHWRGGNPSAGGGLDKKVLQQLAPIKVGQKVTVSWEYEERKRVVNIR